MLPMLPMLTEHDRHTVYGYREGPNLSDGDETEGGGGCQGNARKRDEVVALVSISRRLDSFLLLGFIALMPWISEISYVRSTSSELHISTMEYIGEAEYKYCRDGNSRSNREVEYQREPMHWERCGHQNKHRGSKIQPLYQMQLLLQQRIYLLHYPPEGFFIGYCWCIPTRAMDFEIPHLSVCFLPNAFLGVAPSFIFYCWCIIYAVKLTDILLISPRNLEKNLLSGPLSPSVGKLTQLSTLIIRINKLSGELPKELGLLSNLRFLAFGTNNFSGPLPSELGKLFMLEELYFDSSGVQGDIPTTFSNLTNLRTVWASDNELTGKIPGFIGDWSKLTTL